MQGVAMNCPDCNGAMWNNIGDKTNPKSPDYKCKNKSCGKGVWLDAKNVPDAPPANPRASLPAILALQEQCFVHALKLAGIAKQKGIAPSLDGISAMTAQAMIEAARRGL